MTLHADDYRGQPIDSRQGQSFKPFDARGYTVIECLQCLKGKPWNDYALGLVHGLRPSTLRVIQDSIQLSAIDWRVTVWLKPDGKTIKRIEQEVEVGLPDGCHHGHHLGELIGLRS